MVAGRVLVLNKRGAARRGQAHALQNLIRQTKQQYGRGIAAEPLGDCRALSVPAFSVLGSLPLVYSISFSHFAYYFFTYTAQRDTVFHTLKIVV